MNRAHSTSTTIVKCCGAPWVLECSAAGLKEDHSPKRLRNSGLDEKKIPASLHSAIEGRKLPNFAKREGK